MGWGWFVEKVLPGLFLSVALSVGACAVAVWKTVNDLSHEISTHDRRLSALEVKSENAVTRAEMLETMKRVEQQLQIVLLQSGIKQKVELK
jgi:hypothetical protein